MTHSRHWLFIILFVTSCSTPEVTNQDFYESDLFKAVQLNAVFPDSKTFADCLPKRSLSEIQHEYEATRNKEGFDLKAFVFEHFDVPVSPVSGFKSDTTRGIEEHINQLWAVLTRQPDNFNTTSALLPLPNSYIVPGGRFVEIYYWDSYFTILGLRVSGRMDMVRNMVDNFGYLIDSLGFVPNGNKNYYLSRSQPPFFSLMLNVLAEEDPSALVRYLPAMQKEYEFWMDGETELEKPGDAVEHVVMLSNGGIVNRYWDSDPRPRPESYKEDVHVQVTSKREAEDLYRNLRSACESGWDFSTRWFEEGKGIESIRTTEIIPVDLNCLLYHHEQMLAKAYSATDQNKAAYYRDRADKRRRAILTFMWDPEQNYFFDYHFPSNQRSHALTLAGVFPLYVNMVQPEIAQAVATRLQDDFLMPGGLRTTLVQSGQQWDAPNGWAPLQWMAYGGLRNYGLNSLADAIKNRWLSINTKVYFATGKMMEKYNVADTTLIAGGGEYPNQDGFGWTNGVFLAMKRYEPQSLSIKK